MRINQTLLYRFFVLIILLLLPYSSFAQMFSVGDPDPVQTRAPGIYSVFSAGWEMGTFTYKGETAPPVDQLDFNSNILRLGLESPGIDLNVSLGGNITGMNDHSYVNLNARLKNQATLIRREKLRLFLPLQITTDLKRVRKNDTDFEFQQSSLAIGTGIGSAVRLAENLDFTVRATPNYGFSFSQGNLFGGNIFQFDGNSKIIIRNLIGSNALSIGYHFDYRNYNIEGDLSDYDYSSHSLSIGYAF